MAEVEAALGLSPAPSRQLATARASITTNAVEAVGYLDSSGWTSYSRRKTWWAKTARYHAGIYNYRTVLWGVADLVARGLLIDDRAVAGQLGWQSRFRATPTLLANWPPDLSGMPIAGELIVLKDHAGGLASYDDSRQTGNWRRDVAAVNEALASVNVDLGLEAHDRRNGDFLELQSQPDSAPRP